jgi:hypothetical protein
MTGKAINMSKCGMWTIFAILLSFIAACTESKGTGNTANLPEPQRVPDSMIAALKQGDLVLRRGRDVASYMISQSGVEEKMYSHCGIVQIENGKPVVYHFISSGNKNRQGLVRDAASVFFSAKQNNIVAVKRYPMNKAQLREQSALVNGYYQQHPGFDMNFDMSNTDKLYCSEFVYRVMNKVMGDTAFIKSAEKNGFAYIPIDRLYMNGRAEEVWQMRFK